MSMSRASNIINYISTDKKMNCLTVPVCQRYSKSYGKYYNI